MANQTSNLGLPLDFIGMVPMRQQIGKAFVILDDKAGAVQDSLDELFEATDGALTVGRVYTPGSDATSLLQAVATAARDAGLPWKLRAGVTYTVLGKVTTWTSFYANGSRFVTTNEGQTDPVFEVAPIADDVETVSLTEANTWTLVKGASRIPELAGQKGWTYTIDGAASDIGRAGGDPIRQGQTFTVVTDDGQISTPLRVAFTQPFTGATITRQRVRGQLVVDSLDIQAIPSSEVGDQVERDKLVTIARSNTVVRNANVSNETSTPIKQGIVHEKCENVSYHDCVVNRLGVNQTNYGWNGSLATGITFINCSGYGNRRTIDGHKCCDYRIVGGNFADGIGGHWQHGIYLSGMPRIGVDNSLNPQCIQIAGSDLIGAAEFVIDSPGTAAVNVRGDLLEMAGTIDLRGSRFKIDNSGGQLDTALATDGLDLVRCAVKQGPAYDALRTIEFPRVIDLSNISVDIVGNLNFRVNVLRLGMSGSTSQQVRMEGRVKIGINGGNLPETVASGTDAGTAAIHLFYTVYSGAIGNGYDIDVADMKTFRPWFGGASTASAGAGRANLTMRNIKSFPSVGVTVRYGAVRNIEAVNCGVPLTIDRTGGGAVMIGDENYNFNKARRAQTAVYTNLRYQFPNGHSASSGTFTVEANKIYWLYCDKTIRTNALAITIKTGAAGACRAAIYGITPITVRPQAPIVRAAELADTSVVGTFNMSLPADFDLDSAYYLAMVFSGTPTISMSQGNRQILSDIYGNTALDTDNFPVFMTSAFTYGVLPDAAPTPTVVNGTGAPLLAMKPV